MVYTKKINSNLHKEVKTLLDEVITKEDINEAKNYNFFTISSLNVQKNIYNVDTIKDINMLLKKIDEL